MAGKVRKSCVVCNREVVDINYHMKTHQKDKDYKCSFCPKGFIKKSQLNNHVRVHTLEKPFRCDTCGKGFTQKQNLTRHSKTEHQNLRAFFCVFCEKTFAFKIDQQHHLLQHIREKPYECNICEESFTQMATLNEHIGTHTREKFFKCKICGKPFRHAKGLKYHEDTHLKERMRPHNCPSCDASFLTKSNLTRHVSNIHDNARQFTCPKHPRTFKTSSHRKQHQTIVHEHAGNKKYFCIFCPKGFHANSNLSRHIISHIQEKHFQCQVCDSWFLRSAQRNAHCMRHHGLPK